MNKHNNKLDQSHLRFEIYNCFACLHFVCHFLVGRGRVSRRFLKISTRMIWKSGLCWRGSFPRCFIPHQGSPMPPPKYPKNILPRRILSAMHSSVASKALCHLWAQWRTREGQRDRSLHLREPQTKLELPFGTC